MENGINCSVNSPHLQECYATIVQDKTASIDNLIKIYASISEGSTLREDVAKIKVELDSITTMKDNLL